MHYKDYFKNKRVTVVGLGLLGKRLHDIQFLSRMGAHVTVTDMKTAKELRTSIDALKSYKNISYTFGRHECTDFENKDFILKGQGVRLDSPYIAHAAKQGIPIEMDESLFAKLAPSGVTIIGVTGTRGKTTTTMLMYHILKKAGVRVHLGGNILGTAALPLLTKVRSGDVVVFELSSWQLQGFGADRISPQIAVFTNFMADHLNYYDGSMAKYWKDKAYIFANQKKGDTLIIGAGLAGKMSKQKFASKLRVASHASVPGDWQTYLRGTHNAENIACAVEACRAYGISENDIRKGVESFKGVKGRLQFVRTYRGVSIYNDTCATTPEALSAGVTALAPYALDGRVILIAGGTTKGLPLGTLPKTVQKYAKEIILLPGSGTDELVQNMSGHTMVQVKTLKSAVATALKNAEKGDSILFSPGFTSFGMFTNEYDRGDKFDAIVKGLK